MCDDKFFYIFEMRGCMVGDAIPNNVI